MENLMSNIDLAAIWAQIKERDDVLAVSDLHYIKLIHPDTQQVHLVTWVQSKGIVNVSKVYKTNDIEDKPVEIADYFYILLRNPHPRKQVLLRVDKDGDQLKFSEVLTAAKDHQIVIKRL